MAARRRRSDHDGQVISIEQAPRLVACTAQVTPTPVLPRIAFSVTVNDELLAGAPLRVPRSLEQSLRWPRSDLPIRLLDGVEASTDETGVQLSTIAPYLALLTARVGDRLIGAIDVEAGRFELRTQDPSRSPAAPR